MNPKRLSVTGQTSFRDVTKFVHDHRGGEYLSHPSVEVDNQGTPTLVARRKNWLTRAKTASGIFEDQEKLAAATLQLYGMPIPVDAKRDVRAFAICREAYEWEHCLANVPDRSPTTYSPEGQPLTTEISRVRCDDGGEISIDKSLPSSKTESIREIATHRALSKQSDRVVKYVDSYLDDNDKRHLIMEYCPHGDLAQVAGRLDDYEKKLVSEGKTKNEARDRVWNLKRLLAYDLLRDLADIHQAGYVHRDVKPENFALAKNGSLKIMDFGTTVKEGSFIIDDPVVQPRFASPEALKHGRAVNDSGRPRRARERELLGGRTRPQIPKGERERIKVQALADHPKPALAANSSADMFSAGSTLFKLFTGSLPYESEFSNDVEEAVINGRRANPKLLSPRRSPGLQNMLDRLMTADPEQRPSASEMLKDPLFDGLEDRKERRKLRRELLDAMK